MSGTNPWHLAVLLLIVLIGGWLRVSPLTSRPAWFDEADTWRSAAGASAEPIPIKRFLEWNNHFETPPLAFLLARLSAGALDGPDQPRSEGEPWRPAVWTMRVPALLCSVLLIPGLFVLGRLAAGPTTGLAAAAVAAVDLNMVDQAHQCRMYAVLMFFVVAAMVLAVWLYRQPAGRVWGWTTLGLTLGLAMATLQFAAALWAGLAMAAAVVVAVDLFNARRADADGGHTLRALLDPRGRPVQLTAGLTAAFVIGAALAHIGMFRLLERLLTGSPDNPDMPALAIAREIAVYSKDMIQLGIPGLLLFVVAALGLARLARRCPTAVAVLVGIALANLLILLPFRRMHHFMDVRYLSLIAPALWVGLAYAAVGWRDRRVRVGAAVGLGLFICVQAWQAWRIERFWFPTDRYVLPAVLADLRHELGPDDALAYNPQVLDVLGHYLGVREDERLEAGLYNDKLKLREEPAVPAGFDKRRAVLVVGMLNYEGRLSEARRAIEAVRAHFNATLGPQELDEHLRLNRTLVLRFEPGKVGVRSFGVGEATNAQAR